MGIWALLIMAVISTLAWGSVYAESSGSSCDGFGSNSLFFPESLCQRMNAATPALFSLPLANLAIDGPGGGLPDKPSDVLPADSIRRTTRFQEFGTNHSWSGFISFVSGKTEETAKMTDPYYRHRYPEVSSNWKWLFYQKTPYYYRKGIEFLHFQDGLIRVSLVKQKTNYNELVKGLWTEKAYDMVLESNEGWLRNRAIFGNGRSYFLELSFHFE